MVNETWLCGLWKLAECNYYTWHDVRMMMFAAYMNYPTVPYSEWKTVFDDYTFLLDIALTRIKMQTNQEVN